MDITSLSSIKAFRYNYRIKVRICRTWKAIQFGAEKYNGLHYVMIDEQGDSIHGFMPEDHVEDMNEKPLQGQMYDIYQFCTKQHCYGLRVVENRVVIHFNSRTVFCKVPETDPPVPLHCFRLIQFSALATERELQHVPSSQAILTDVYGFVKSIRPPHPQFIRSQNKMGVKCEFVLENIQYGSIKSYQPLHVACCFDILCLFMLPSFFPKSKREILTIVFWGKLAKDFDLDAMVSLPPPVLAVFTGLKIGEFNNRVGANNHDHTCILLEPPTPWTDAYKAEFSKPGDKIAILGDCYIFETNKPKDIVSVQVLSGLNPDEYNARSIQCKGQIIKIGTQGWWYRCCPQASCHKQCLKMEDLDDKYRCKIHGVQTPIPCFRVSTLIADEFSTITVTVMGNQAEQLFGCKLDHLRAKRFYISEQSIPPELSAAIAQVHIFKVKGNKYGEWTAMGVEPAKDDMTTTHPPTDTETPSATMVPELAVQTPEKTNTHQKRTSAKIQETLFTDSKRTRRESEEVSSSANEDKEKVD